MFGPPIPMNVRPSEGNNVGALRGTRFRDDAGRPVLRRCEPHILQTREWEGNIFFPGDAINVAPFMHGFASLITCKVNSQIYGLIA